MCIIKLNFHIFLSFFRLHVGEGHSNMSSLSGNTKLIYYSYNENFFKFTVSTQYLEFINFFVNVC